MKKALIVKGGWTGHEPVEVGSIFQDILESEGFSVTVSESLESFDDVDALVDLDLIVPVWTMGELTGERSQAVSTAVGNGTGIAGCHGGMCDAFRDNTLWQFMTGGNWVSHPGGDETEYAVNIVNSSSPLVAGLEDFKVQSEQYYLHVDPVVEVLATTRFPIAPGYHSTNRAVDMPVVWTKRWGHGRVYYNSLGHNAAIMEMPTPREMMRRGFLWAAEGKAIAQEQGLDGSIFENT